jgi:hypothetical protein
MVAFNSKRKEGRKKIPSLLERRCAFFRKKGREILPSGVCASQRQPNFECTAAVKSVRLAVNSQELAGSYHATVFWSLAGVYC